MNIQNRREYPMKNITTFCLALLQKILKFTIAAHSAPEFVAACSRKFFILL